MGVPYLPIYPLMASGLARTRQASEWIFLSPTVSLLWTFPFPFPYPIENHTVKLQRERSLTITSDGKRDAEGLSKTSRKMFELYDEVVADWEQRVRETVPTAAGLSHPILVDTLPALYGNIAEALTPKYPRTTAGVPATTVASEHGNERARLTEFDLAAVISEYQLLRISILHVLGRNNVPLSTEEIQVITSSLDATMKEAVTSFALVQSVFREQFMSALTHDLRNPLATAVTALELIQHINDPARAKELAARAGENLQQVDRMIQDLLDTLVFQHGNRKPLHLSRFDMLDLAKHVCAQATFKHGARFEVMGEPIQGYWDHSALKRALENLVDNAVKYGAENASIHIRVEHYDERAMLSVQNEGSPIPQEQLETVFQVYRRAKAAKEGDKQGWGIGLPYVRSVAESHGGSIGVDSTVERGTIFTIDFPLDARPYLNVPILP